MHLQGINMLCPISVYFFKVRTKSFKDWHLADEDQKERKQGRLLFVKELLVAFSRPKNACTLAVKEMVEDHQVSEPGKNRVLSSVSRTPALEFKHSLCFHFNALVTTCIHEILNRLVAFISTHHKGLQVTNLVWSFQVHAFFVGVY